MGVSYSGYDGRSGNMAGAVFSLDLKKPVDISGYDRVLQNQNLVNNRAAQATDHFEGNGISYVASDGLNTMNLTVGDAQSGLGSIPLDIGAFADKLLREYRDAGYSITSNMAPEAMSIVAERNGQKVKLLFRHLNLVRQNGKTVISSFTADILYTVRK